MFVNNQLKLIPIGAIVILTGCGHLPKDSQIVQRFINDRVTMDELCNKLAKEPSRVIGFTNDRVMVKTPYDWIEPEVAGISLNHFLEYKTLMQEVGISQMWRSDGETCFYITGFGFAGDGWRLNYVYTSVVPEIIVPTIDYPNNKTNGAHGPIYRSLGDHWYIKLIVE